MPRTKKKWSRQVTENSRALALEEGVFTFTDPRKIARSLRKSALASTARKASPFQSAMSMLNFYINRAGARLDPGQKKILTQAKDELRDLFNRRPQHEK